MRDPQDEGTVYREGPGTNVEVRGGAHLLDISGVECINSGDPEADRRYRKRFTRKPIYLPGEYPRAVSEILRGTDVVVLGMNGYSDVSEAKCRAWGVKHGAYEAACKALLTHTIEHLQERFPGVDIRLAHGASAMGVDGVSIGVARKLNRPQLGHSCPRFMFYVDDDDVPVHVAATQAEYADSFVRSLDILIAANGRVQAFEHDIQAAFRLMKHVIPVNVLRSISTNGGPPAIGPEGTIEDAVAAFEQRVHMVSQFFGMAGIQTMNMFPSLLEHVDGVTEHIIRQLLSPERAFARFM